MRTIDKLIIAGGRASGRTEAVIRAVGHKKDATIICHSHQFAKVIRDSYPGIKANVVCLEDLDKLVGISGPVFADHAAWERAFCQAESEWNQMREFLEKQIATLKKQKGVR